MRVCFFDIDGTLVATGGAGQKAFAAAFLELFGIQQISCDIPFAGRSDRAIAADLFRVHNVAAGESTWQAFRKSYLQHLEAHLKVCVGTVLPGVEQLIGRLQQYPQVGVGLLTGNIAPGAAAKLTHYRLWHHFAYGGFGDEHHNRDDIARAALVAASQHHRMQPDDKSRIAVIGDTVHDIRCARAIGAYAVAVPTGFTPIDELRAADPDLAVETLEDCHQLVEWLTA
jgi:phosphoglycolate phosphatase-like HAD superfamily hydrolase